MSETRTEFNLWVHHSPVLGIHLTGGIVLFVHPLTHISTLRSMPPQHTGGRVLISIFQPIRTGVPSKNEFSIPSKQQDDLLVKPNSESGKVAGAIAGRLREDKPVALQACLLVYLFPSLLCSFF